MTVSKIAEIKQQAEADLFVFASLMNPTRIYGNIHRRAFRFLQSGQLDQLLLLPRGHQKSHCIAMWCAWWITKHPEVTMIYASATEDLAVTQLYAIKNILESPVYRRYWADMILPEEAKREEWNVKNIKVDHPKRKEMGVRDRTVAARSIEANTTGLHCDVLVCDDIVVPENAYTNEGRQRVKDGYAQFASVLNTGGFTKVVGTLYHGKDAYHMLMDMEVEQFDDEGNIIGAEKVYEIMSASVEEAGEYIWPRTQHPKTQKWFGFNQKELARIKAKYMAAGMRNAFYAQYYNDLNVQGDEAIKSEMFQYYDRKYLTCTDGQWLFKGKPLLVFAAGDLAYTETDTADFTAFAVIGLDEDGYIYILELDQFKTTKYQRIYQSIERLHLKWQFKKLRLETNAGANLVAEYVKDEVRKNGLTLVVEGKPSRGDKVERAQMLLLPRYENRTIWHYTGGLITTYEEQIILSRPSNDDLRDAVGAAVEISKPAPKRRQIGGESRGKVISINDRYGGRVR